jgi:hypothetical protein
MQNRQTHLCRSPCALPRKRDSQWDTAHFVEAQYDALLHFRFHHTFNDFPRLIGGTVLKKSHRAILDFTPKSSYPSLSRLHTFNDFAHLIGGTVLEKSHRNLLYRKAGRRIYNP